LSENPAIFPHFLRNIVRVGEESGQLELALQQLAAFYELDDQTLKRLRTAMRYPVMVLLTIVVAFTIVNIVVLPAFAKFFAQYHATLPWMTRLLLGLSHFIVQYGVWIVAFMVAGSIAILHYVRSPEGQYRWDQTQLRIPIVGQIFQRILFARFARCLAMVLRTDMVLSQGLLLTADAINNAFFKKRILLMQESIQHGENMLTAATKINFFSPLVLQMLAVGEEAGSLSNMLEEIADFYESEVDYDLKKLSDALEPFLLFIVAIMVFILAIGIFMPMWRMSSVILHH
jgi:MSHA biogenesis protein MshG